MLMALVLASMTQFRVVVEQQAPVVYELPPVQAVRSMTYEYSSVPMVQTFTTVPMVTYSAPAFTYMMADPMVQVSVPLVAGRNVIRVRGPGGYRRRIVVRN
jgi:hypothetical protein